MTRRAELSESLEISTNNVAQDSEPEHTLAVKYSAADFLNEYIGVLNSTDFGSHGSDMSKDSGRKFASGIYEEYLRDQGR